MPDSRDLIEQALQARENSFSPYSRFRVGASLLAASGKVYQGTNVESSSYGLSICAERHAIGAAVVRGEREFSRMVVSSDRGVMPCGACRQVIWDVCGDIEILCVDQEGRTVKTLRSSDLLPEAFSAEDLNP